MTTAADHEGKRGGAIRPSTNNDVNRRPIAPVAGVRPSVAAYSGQLLEDEAKPLIARVLSYSASSSKGSSSPPLTVDEQKRLSEVLQKLIGEHPRYACRVGAVSVLFKGYDEAIKHAERAAHAGLDALGLVSPDCPTSTPLRPHATNLFDEEAFVPWRSAFDAFQRAVAAARSRLAAFLDKVQSFASSIDGRELQARLRISLGNVHRYEDRLATEVLRRLVATNRGDEEVSTWLEALRVPDPSPGAMAQRGQHRRAQAEYEEARTLLPGHGQAHHLLGLIFAGRGDTFQAASAYMRAATAPLKAVREAAKAITALAEKEEHRWEAMVERGIGAGSAFEQVTQDDAYHDMATLFLHLVGIVMRDDRAAADQLFMEQDSSRAALHRVLVSFLRAAPTVTSACDRFFLRFALGLWLAADYGSGRSEAERGVISARRRALVVRHFTDALHQAAVVLPESALRQLLTTTDFPAGFAVLLCDASTQSTVDAQHLAHWHRLVGAVDAAAALVVDGPSATAEASSRSRSVLQSKPVVDRAYVLRHLCTSSTGQTSTEGGDRRTSGVVLVDDVDDAGCMSLEDLECKGLAVDTAKLLASAVHQGLTRVVAIPGAGANPSSEFHFPSEADRSYDRRQFAVRNGQNAPPRTGLEQLLPALARLRAMLEMRCANPGGGGGAGGAFIESDLHEALETLLEED